MLSIAYFVLAKILSHLAGFILNLENLENRIFFTKIQGKPEIVRECSIIFPSQEKMRENKSSSPHIIFINSLHGFFAKWLFHLLSVSVNFTALHSTIASICALPIY